MAWSIEYSCSEVEEFVLSLPSTMAAKYLWLSDLMIEFGSNLRMPHGKSERK
jgi:hypothetical protein